nr:hypothetical protein [Bacillus fungorum]
MHRTLFNPTGNSIKPVIIVINVDFPIPDDPIPTIIMFYFLFENDPLDTYVLVTEFQPEKYEYMIYEETRVARQLHQILKPYGIDINNEFEEFLKLQEIP